MKRVGKMLAAGLVVALVAGGLYTGIKWAYGGFDDYYYVKATLPRAGQQLEPGSDVRMRGVIVGKVSDIRLVDRQAQLTLQMQRQYHVPKDAEAVISLTTFLGAKFVDLRFDQMRGPYLADGDRIQSSHVGAELEDALADGVRVFDAIPPADLATVVGELATGARGHGQDVARGLAANSDLSDLFASTLTPQIQALHDFQVVFGALRDRGVDLNNLADAINEGVPVYASASAQKALDDALKAVTPFADNLADLLILDKAAWDQMMDAGDKVLGTIAARPEQLAGLVQGLYRYVFKLGGVPCYPTTFYNCTVPKNSAAAGFVNFIGCDGPDCSDKNRQQLCFALPPEIREHAPLCQDEG